LADAVLEDVQRALDAGGDAGGRRVAGIRNPDEGGHVDHHIRAANRAGDDAYNSRTNSRREMETPVLLQAKAPNLIQLEPLAGQVAESAILVRTADLAHAQQQPSDGLLRDPR
jgi:hypothetical protein